MVCDKCGHTIPEGEEYCGFCGRPVSEGNGNSGQNSGDSKKAIIVTIVIVAIVICLIVLVIVKGIHDKKESERRVLEVLEKSNFSQEMNDIYEDFEEDAEKINSEIEEKERELHSGE